jgi:hypothetical protein
MEGCSIYARVTTGEFNPGKIDEAVKIWNVAATV